MCAAPRSGHWRCHLVKEPNSEDCTAVARRFVKSAAPSAPTHILEHVVETAIWNLFRTREDGDLELLWDDRDWEWPELTSHCLTYPQFFPNKEPVYYLLNLTTARIRASVQLTLSASAPEHARSAQDARDLARAKQLHESSQRMDLETVSTQLRSEFVTELGAAWRDCAAARNVFDAIIRKLQNDKARSINQWRDVAASFSKTVYRLHVERCPLCVHLNKPDVLEAPTEAALPPYHCSCTCEVAWRDDLASPNIPIHGPEFQRVMAKWAAENIHGLSVRPPSIRDMVDFEEAHLRDSDALKKSTLWCHIKRLAVRAWELTSSKIDR